VLKTEADEEKLALLEKYIAAKDYAKIRFTTSLLISRDIPHDDIRMRPALEVLAAGRLTMCQSLQTACSLNTVKHMNDILEAYASYAEKATYDGWVSLVNVGKALCDAVVHPPMKFADGVAEDVLYCLVAYDKYTAEYQKVIWSNAHLSAPLLIAKAEADNEVTKFGANFSTQVKQLSADMINAPPLTDIKIFKTWKAQLKAMASSQIGHSAWWRSQAAIQTDLRVIAAEADMLHDHWEFFVLDGDEQRDAHWVNMDFPMMCKIAALVANIEPCLYLEKVTAVRGFLRSTFADVTVNNVLNVFPDRRIAFLNALGDTDLSQITPLELVEGNGLGFIDTANCSLQKLLGADALQRHAQSLEGVIKNRFEFVCEAICELSPSWWEGLKVCLEPCDYSSVASLLPSARLGHPAMTQLFETLAKMDIEAEALPVFIRDSGIMLENVLRVCKVTHAAKLPFADVYAHCVNEHASAIEKAEKYKQSMAKLHILQNWMAAVLGGDPDGQCEGLKAVSQAFTIGKKGTGKWDNLASWATWHSYAFVV
jgi:hypothetical protein